MESVSTRAGTTGEEAVRTLLLSRLDAAYRLATCILRDPVAAEDAVQEAALRAWSMRRGLRDPDRAEAWFARIVVNVCRAELGKRSRQRLVVQTDSVPATDGSPELRDEVARAVARLNVDEQVVVAMRYGRDLTVPQIAQLTGIREGTVKSRLHNAQEHLRAAFDAERRAEEVGRRATRSASDCARTTNRSSATRRPTSKPGWSELSTPHPRLGRRACRGGPPWVLPRQWRSSSPRAWSSPAFDRRRFPRRRPQPDRRAVHRPLRPPRPRRPRARPRASARKLRSLGRRPPRLRHRRRRLGRRRPSPRNSASLAR